MMDINIMFLGSAVLISALLVINYIYLIKKYNKDKLLPIKTTSEKELLKKYSSVICACIIKKRNTCSKDVLATIVDLISKNILSVSSKRITKDGRIVNEYRLRYVNKSEKITDYEKDILDIIFKSNDECVLNDVLEEKNFRNANNNNNKRMAILGINGKKVPKINQIMNTVLFIFVCLFIILHIAYNFNASISFNDIVTNVKYWSILIIKIDVIACLTLSFFKIVSLIKERINSKNLFYKIEFTDSLILKIFFNFFISSLIMLIVLAFIPISTYFVADILLFDIAMVLMVTDEIMVTHSPRIFKDYISLKKFESKLKSNSLFEFVTPEVVEEMVSYLPIVISLDDSNIDLKEYVQRIIDTCLDENELKKYTIIQQILNFKENEIRKFYNVN